jgi:hypothetical protein
VTEAVGEFENSEEEAYPPLEAVTRGLLRTRLMALACNGRMYIVLTICVVTCPKIPLQIQIPYIFTTHTRDNILK